ncbi:MAG: DeoR/GlpR family DNA-binding transcription regulator [Anaerolineae bacterium]
MTISAQERQRRIVEHIEKNGRVGINEVCEIFDISIATARRDLEALADQGEVERVHGGAIRVERAPAEPPINQRHTEQYEEKRRIAVATAEMVNDGETIYLGAGTTMEAVAARLQQRQGLTVITNSLLVVNALAGQPQIELICLGGLLRHSEMCFIGHLTEQALAYVRADKAILGTRAIDIEHGLTNDHLPQTSTDRASLAIGRQVIIAADHTKVARVSTGFVAPIDAIHTFVTDKNTQPEFITALASRGVNVRQV